MLRQFLKFALEQKLDIFLKYLSHPAVVNGKQKKKTKQNKTKNKKKITDAASSSEWTGLNTDLYDADAVLHHSS